MKLTLPSTIYVVSFYLSRKAAPTRFAHTAHSLVMPGVSPLTDDQAKALGRLELAGDWPAENGPLTDWREQSALVVRFPIADTE